MNVFVLSRCLIGAAAICFIWFVLFAALRRDNFRSNVRRVRDDLFDFMRKNGGDFSNPGYVEARQFMNHVIYLGGVLTPIMFVMQYIMMFRNAKPSVQSVINSMEEGPLKAELMRARQQVVSLGIRFLFYEGLFGLFIKLLFVVFRLAHVATKVKDWFLRIAEPVFLQAPVYNYTPPKRNRRPQCMTPA